MLFVICYFVLCFLNMLIQLMDTYIQLINNTNILLSKQPKIYV